MRAPAPAGGLATNGKPTRSANVVASLADATRALRGARHAGCLEGGLHARLVTEVVSDTGGHAGDAESLANRADRHLRVLEDRDEAIDGAEVATHRGDRVGQLVGVQAIVESPMTGHGEADRWREGLDRIGADQPDPSSRYVGDGIDEPGGRLERVRRHEHDVGHRRRTVVPAEPAVVRRATPQPAAVEK